MKALIVLAALLTAAPSTPIKTGPGTEYYDGLPPERYVHEGAAIVLFVGDVTQVCGMEVPAGMTLIACTRETKDGTPVIIMPHPQTFGRAGDWYARVLSHELSHAQGWPGNHPA